MKCFLPADLKQLDVVHVLQYEYISLAASLCSSKSTAVLFSSAVLRDKYLWDEAPLVLLE